MTLDSSGLPSPAPLLPLPIRFCVRTPPILRRGSEGLAEHIREGVAEQEQQQEEAGQEEEKRGKKECPAETAAGPTRRARRHPNFLTTFLLRPDGLGWPWQARCHPIPSPRAQGRPRHREPLDQHHDDDDGVRRDGRANKEQKGGKKIQSLNKNKEKGKES